MAIAIETALQKRFEDIFKAPKLEDILALEPPEFERFVGYVFTCAGYTVELVSSERFPDGPGVDLDLYTSESAKRPIARIEARRYKPDRKLRFSDVARFLGVLQLAGGIPGYLVTTSDFADPATIAAEMETAHGKARLVNGKDLMRYITYIGGSRAPDASGLKRTPVPVSPDWLLSGSHSLQNMERSNAYVLTVANNKGGVAKTTTALNLGLALAERGKRVLLVDMDGQASLTASLPLPEVGTMPSRTAPPPERKHFITEYFAGQVSDLGPLVQLTRFSNLWVLPANGDMHRMDTGGGARPEAEAAFVRAIHSPSLMVPSIAATTQALNTAPVSFDWIILDTSPAQTFFTRLALGASDGVLMPINVEAFVALGLSHAFDTIRTMQALSGGAKVIGYTITRWKSTAYTRGVIKNLQFQLDAEGVPLLVTAIPYDSKIDEALSTTMAGGLRGLFGFNRSAAAASYRDLLDEMLKKVGHA